MSIVAPRLSSITSAAGDLLNTTDPSEPVSEGETIAGGASQYLLAVLAVAAPINVFPLPAILIVVLMAIGLCGRLFARLRLDRISALVLLNYLYWVLSILVVASVSLSDVLTYDFFRNDGRSFFAYLPLLYILGLRVSDGLARQVLVIWLAAAAVIAAFGILEYLGIRILPGVHLTERIHDRPRMFLGLQRSHNAAGMYYAIVGLTWSTILGVSPRSADQSESGWPLRVGILRAMTAVVLVATILSGSRATYLGLVAAAIVIAAQSGRLPLLRRSLLAAVVIGVLILTIGSDLRSRLVETDLNEHNVAVRLELWEQAPDLIRQSPLIGIGYSRWNDVVLRDAAPLPLETSFPHLIGTGAGTPVRSIDDTAHNSYLMILAEQGIFGLFLMLAVWCKILIELRKRVSDPEVGETFRALSIAATALVFFLFAASLAGHAMASPSSIMAISIPIGLLIAMPAREYRSSV